MNHLEQHCEEIDAMVYSGELLYFDAQRKLLAHYISRWTRALAEIYPAPDEEPTL